VWVIEALQKIGNGTWFQVVERIGLDNLIKERQLIRSTREQYEGEKNKKLKPLKFAGLILEGAVVGYDREADKKRGCTISDNDIVVVPKMADIVSV